MEVQPSAGTMDIIVKLTDEVLDILDIATKEIKRNKQVSRHTGLYRFR